MRKERVQQVGAAGLIGALAGAALAAHRGKAAAALVLRYRMHRKPPPRHGTLGFPG